jgi:hypothetical protein
MLVGVVLPSIIADQIEKQVVQFLNTNKFWFVAMFTAQKGIVNNLKGSGSTKLKIIEIRH